MRERDELKYAFVFQLVFGEVEICQTCVKHLTDFIDGIVGIHFHFSLLRAHTRRGLAVTNGRVNSSFRVVWWTAGSRRSKCTVRITGHKRVPQYSR
jgi:hypothetical protein